MVRMRKTKETQELLDKLESVQIKTFDLSHRVKNIESQLEAIRVCIQQLREGKAK